MSTNHGPVGGSNNGMFSVVAKPTGPPLWFKALMALLLGALFGLFVSYKVTHTPAVPVAPSVTTQPTS